MIIYNSSSNGWGAYIGFAIGILIIVLLFINSFKRLSSSIKPFFATVTTPNKLSFDKIVLFISKTTLSENPVILNFPYQ